MSVDGQAPPHDLAAEAALLSAVMIRGDGRALDELAGIVNPESFYSESHRRIFEACVELHRKGKPQDVVMVLGWLKDHGRLEQCGGSSYLTQVLDAVPHVPNLPHYAAVVRDAWRTRQVILRCQSIAARGYTPIDDVQAFIDSAQSQLHELARVSQRSQFETFDVVARRVHHELTENSKAGSDLPGHTTGFRQLDNRILGLRPGRSHIVAARPGVGKTALAMNIAWTVAAPKPEGQPQDHVAFFTLEMHNTELAIRALSAESKIDQTRFGRAKLLRGDDWNRIIDSMRRARGVNLHLCDDVNITIAGVRALVRQLAADLQRRGDRLGLVVVDYLQLMKDESARGDSHREQEVSGISRGLKKLAMELSVPVIALSQLNRASEKHGGEAARPRKSELRESGSLEQDADVVILIHRLAKPKTPGPSRLQRGPQVHELIVDKARGGTEGIIRVQFDKPIATFSELEPDAGDDPADDGDAEAAQ